MDQPRGQAEGDVERGVPPVIGLTGGVGAGKSTTLQAFANLGAATLSADAVVHDLLADPEIVVQVVARFGSDVERDGEVDRDRLAKIVFADDAGREWLEGTIWPLVGLRMFEWRSENLAADPAPCALVIEIPLLFESGLEVGFDATVCVAVDEKLRRDRADSRGQVAVSEREARQLSPAEKAARADYVITNDGTLADLQAKVAALLGTIVVNGDDRKDSHQT